MAVNNPCVLCRSQSEIMINLIDVLLDIAATSALASTSAASVNLVRKSEQIPRSINTRNHFLVLLPKLHKEK